MVVAMECAHVVHSRKREVDVVSSLGEAMTRLFTFAIHIFAALSAYHKKRRSKMIGSTPKGIRVTNARGCDMFGLIRLGGFFSKYCQIRTRRWYDEVIPSSVQEVTAPVHIGLIEISESAFLIEMTELDNFILLN